MNPIGVYFTYWEPEWKADIQAYLKKAKRLGFDVLEMSVVNLLDKSDAEIADIRRAAADEGLKLIFGLGLGPEQDVSSKDPAVRRAGIEFAKLVLEKVHKAGSDMFGGITYASWQTLPRELDFDIRPYWENSLASVREICKTAEDLGVSYLLESVNRFEGYLINRAEDGVAFLKELNSPAAGLLLDTFHMNVEEDSFEEAIHTAGAYLRHFHIGEANRKAPGKGRIPWVEITKALGDIGYGGPIVMEPFLRPGGQVGQDIKVWHDQSKGASVEELDCDIHNSLLMMRALLGLNTRGTARSPEVGF